MRKNNQMMIFVGVVSAVLLVLGFVTVGTMTDAFIFDAIDSGEENPTPEAPDSSTEMLDWQDHELALDVVAPVATNFTTSAFVAEPDEDGDYGNYVDYNQTEAQSGLSAGVDYYQESATDSKTVTYPANLDLPAGETLDLAVVDDTGAEYHDTFTEMDVPSEVAKIDYENDNSLSVVSSSAFTRLPDYSDDSSEITQINGDSTDFSDFGTSSTDLADDAYDSETDQTVEVDRTIEMNHGAMALGEVNVDNVSSNVAEATIQVSYEDENGNTVSLFDEQVADSDGQTDFEEALTEDMETSPEFVNSDLTVTYEVEFDGSSVSSDEELLSAEILNIYGNSVGQDALVNVTA